MRLELDLPIYWGFLSKLLILLDEKKDEVLRANDVMFVVAGITHKAGSKAE